MKETIKCQRMVYNKGYYHACLFKVVDYCKLCVLPYCARHIHLTKHECEGVANDHALELAGIRAIADRI